MGACRTPHCKRGGPRCSPNWAGRSQVSLLNSDGESLAISPSPAHPFCPCRLARPGPCAVRGHAAMKITEVAPAESSPSDRDDDGRCEGGSSSSSSSSSPPTNETASGEGAASAPLIPTTQEHWLDQKANIEELYVRKNLILKDVIDIMLEEQGFKAT